MNIKTGSSGISLVVNNRLFLFVICLCLGIFLFGSVDVVWKAGSVSALRSIVTFLYPPRLLLILLEFFLVCRLLFLVIKAQNVSEALKNISVLMSSVLLLFLILEGVFMFIPKSFGTDSTLATRNWLAYFWKPINKLKFRDNELVTDSTSKNILVLGDSLAAGHGIKDIDDRFSNLLGRLLQGRYKVFNAGERSADTRIELNILSKYPIKPDILILQYYGNDIEPVAIRQGVAFEKTSTYQNLNAAVRYFVRHSFFFNYLYQQFPHETAREYLDFLHAAYSNEKAFTAHLSDLNKFVVYAKQGNIPLIVILFPLLEDVEAGSFYIEPVRRFFDDKGVRVINVEDFVGNLPVKERIVNSYDAHPGIAVHRLVAGELYRIITADIR